MTTKKEIHKDGHSTINVNEVSGPIIINVIEVLRNKESLERKVSKLLNK